jgi:lipoprotein-anchoring transpeptidase ErfK/SrfK
MIPSAHPYRTILVLVSLAALLLVTAPTLAVAAPAAPIIVRPASGHLVASTFTITGRVDASVTAVRVEGAATATVTLLPADSTGATFTVRTVVRYGRTRLAISASDGAQWSDAATLTVWALKAVPHQVRMVLVDKSDFMLYVVRSSRVVAAFPVAIGMYGAPTPTGTFYLKRPVRSPNSVWGPFRMPLYRWRTVRVRSTVRVGGRLVHRWRTVRRLVASSYYIHGTNNPASIGTRASHGCVRMFNSNLRAFRYLTVKNEYTLIRR